MAEQENGIWGISCDVCEYRQRVPMRQSAVTQADPSLVPRDRARAIVELRRHYKNVHKKTFSKTTLKNRSWFDASWGVPEDQLEAFGMYFRSRTVRHRRDACLKVASEQLLELNERRTAECAEWDRQQLKACNGSRDRLLDWQMDVLATHWERREEWNDLALHIFSLGLLLVWRDFVLADGLSLVQAQIAQLPGAGHSPEEQQAIDQWITMIDRFDAQFRDLALAGAGAECWDIGAKLHYNKTVVPALRPFIGQSALPDVRPSSSAFLKIVNEVVDRFERADYWLLHPRLKKGRPSSYNEEVHMEGVWIRGVLEPSPLASEVEVGEGPKMPLDREEIEQQKLRHQSTFNRKVAQEWLKMTTDEKQRYDTQRRRVGQT